MIALATIQDFTDRYGNDFSVDEETHITTLLGDASAFVCDVAGKDWTVVDPDDNSVSLGAVPALIVIVVCEAARRAFENPAGLQSETMGDYTWRAGASGGVGVFLTETEKTIVRRAAGKFAITSVDMTSPLPAPRLDPLISRYLSSLDEDEFEIPPQPGG
jgi:hypothetical protein